VHQSEHSADAMRRYVVDNHDVLRDRPTGKGLDPALVIRYAGPGLVFFTAVAVYSGYATVRGVQAHNGVLELLGPIGAVGGFYMVVAIVRGIVRKDHELRVPASGRTVGSESLTAEAHTQTPTPADRHRVATAILRGDPIRPSDRQTAELLLNRWRLSGFRRVFNSAPVAILFAVMGTIWLIEGHGPGRFVRAGRAFAAMAGTIVVIRRQDRNQRWRAKYLTSGSIDHSRNTGDNV
jgi:hypothetical protein